LFTDLKRASNFDASDPLVSLLLQVTGPTHIPWDDPIWEELLYGYNVWVHVDAPPPHLLAIQIDDSEEYDDDESDNSDDSTEIERDEVYNDNQRNNSNRVPAQEQQYRNIESFMTSFMIRVCQSGRRHSARTSNLASLTIHAIQTIRDLTSNIKDVTSTTISPNNHSNSSISNQSGNGTSSSSPSKIVYLHQNNKNKSAETVETNNPSFAAFSNRITLVGKCRAVAGSLNLLRILVHAVIGQENLLEKEVTQQQSTITARDPIQDYFTYHSRDRTSGVMLFRRLRMNSAIENKNTAFIDVGYDLVASILEFIECAATILPTTWNDVPELYDAIVLSFQLLLVLLSTQLYRPMVSSHQYKMTHENGNNMGYFWKILLDQAILSVSNGTAENPNTPTPWSVLRLLTVLLEWQVDRPGPPYKSIQYHRTQLMQQIVGNLLNHQTLHRHPHLHQEQYASMKIGPDGLYEGYSIVQSCAPTIGQNNLATPVGNGTGTLTNSMNNTSTGNLFGQSSHDFVSNSSNRSNIIDLSSKLLSLPLRILSLVLGILARQNGNGGTNIAYNQQIALLLQLQQSQIKKRIREQTNTNRSVTKDVVFITDSPIADLSVSILLLLINNDRDGNVDDDNIDNNTTKDGTRNGDIDSSVLKSNPFRQALNLLVDDRWEDLSPRTGFSLDSRMGLLDVSQSEHEMGVHTNGSSTTINGVATADTTNQVPRLHRLRLNFEALFASFGRTVHNEVGAMFLYTLLQVSPAFAQSLAVRSDLDTIVLPMLRTLYFSTALRKFSSASTMNATRTPSSSSTTTTKEQVLQRPILNKEDTASISTQNFPFRSQSQLYVIVILFLMFSQDPSFGSDAFRRIEISTVSWYKERNLKNINLGSVLILCMLRSLVFILNRLRDPFLLSNCCAVLMNLSPSATNIQEYAATRLVAVTVSFLKRYYTLLKQSPKGAEENDEKMITSLAQHGEASRTLLRLIKHGLSVKNIAQNIHLVYAVAYHNSDWERHFTERGMYFLHLFTPNYSQEY
jgi:Dyggve-Melchior-Clausen syndrome protein